MTPVFYRILKHSTPQRQVGNLSIGGVRIYSDEPLDTGQTVELEFVFPNGSDVKVAARVVWIKKQPPRCAGVYDVGLEFTELSEAALKQLDAVLEKN
jgi:Tfp pilus assembly protein PilZ